ncbi:multiple sugar transport system substrate-binding protein [Amycolatopsis lexingtonensis]|uniref:Multiple sugar transport system substrate-binding protein n=1 Tax=Amycolatopsis lexingtonensis TaxID=218822 RepID=A0ABR9HU76_9PSEU|nr:extracellular solute-binding protein [Amycolatopsis lexingtonensis]MBE1494470.1 multiple sugar transport system substrate-binding protein [Amycolatopsis lexingtonensis]
MGRTTVRGTRRGLAALAVVVPLLLTGVAACGSGSGSGDGDVTITFVWWGSDGRANLTKKAVELFQRKNPKIKVQTSFSAYAAYWEKLATQTAGGKPPDVLNVDTRYLAEYGGRGVLADLNQGAGKAISLADVNPELAATGVYQGKRYAVPWAQNTPAMIYDPAAFTAAGADPAKGMTWQQYADATQKVSAASGFAARGATDFGILDTTLEIWLRQQGKQFYTPEGKLGFTADDLRRYWQLASSFRDAKGASPADVTASYNTSPEQAPLGKKLTSSEFAYDNLLPAYQKANGKPLNVAPYPSDKAGETGQYRRPSMFLAVSARSAQQEAAAKLVDFLVNDAEVGKIVGTDRGLAPNLKVRAQLAGSATGNDKTLYDYEAALEPKLGAAPPVPPKGAGAIQKLLQRTYEEVAFGRMSIDDAVSRFMTEAEKGLS